MVREKAAVLSMAEACVYLSLSRPTVERILNQEKIPSFHVGRRRLVLREHLDQFLRRRLAAAGYDDRGGKGQSTS